MCILTWTYKIGLLIQLVLIFLIDISLALHSENYLTLWYFKVFLLPL